MWDCEREDGEEVARIGIGRGVERGGEEFERDEEESGKGGRSLSLPLFGVWELEGWMMDKTGRFPSLLAIGFDSTRSVVVGFVGEE